MTERKRRCIHCGRELPEDVHFCLACGTRQILRPGAHTGRSAGSGRAVLFILGALVLTVGLAVTGVLLLNGSRRGGDLPEEVPTTAVSALAPARETDPETGFAPESRGTVETAETEKETAGEALTGKDLPAEKTPDPVRAPAATAKDEPVHTHDFQSVVTFEPSCEKEGVRTLTCTVCGATKTESIPATGHDYKQTSLGGPTCTDARSVDYTCAVCGAKKTETLPALGHTTEDGVCARCGLFCYQGKTVKVQSNLKSQTDNYFMCQGAMGYQDFRILSCSLYTSGGTLHIKGKATAAAMAFSPDTCKVTIYAGTASASSVASSRVVTVIPSNTGAGVTVDYDVAAADLSSLTGSPQTAFYLYLENDL